MVSISDAPQRILVVKLADLGDALLASPAIRGLRLSFPRARIEALTAPAGATVLRLCPELDDVLVFDKQLFDAPGGLLRPANARRQLALGLQLRRRRYDAVVLLHHLTSRFGAAKYRALCLATGASIRAGLDNGRGDFLTHRALDYGYGARTELDYGLAVVATLGARPADSAPGLSIPDDVRRNARAMLGEAGIKAPYLVVHPSVGVYAPVRNWSPERLGEVARRLSDELSLRVVVVGASDAREPAEVVARHVPVVNLVGRTTVAELATILEDAALVLGSDSGVMHLAAAVNTPLVAVFGPSNQDAWHPYGAVVWQPGDPLPRGKSVAVRAGLPCSPCLYTGYALGRRAGCGLPTCLDRVTADHVARIAIHLLTSDSADE